MRFDLILLDGGGAESAKRLAEKLQSGPQADMDDAMTSGPERETLKGQQPRTGFSDCRWQVVDYLRRISTINQDRSVGGARRETGPYSDAIHLAANAAFGAGVGDLEDLEL